MSNIDKPGKELSEQQVSDFLTANPDFFDRHPRVIENLELPHESGKAVSLIERQISVLRDRNIEMRRRLNNLLESARTNDKLFEKTKRLVLTILESQDLDSVVSVLYDSLGTDFKVEFHNLILLGEVDKIPHSHAKVVGLDEANNAIGTLLRTNRAICGVLRHDELEFLFGEDAPKIGSVAAVPLCHGSIFGILAIGNSDPNRYRSSMGTLFLSYIAEVLNRVAPKLLN
ncbi:MAG: DUF484 domain-containing protein [Gammaproteobacteria bacterium]|nr:MAG: DUF484 domain-containing protein [Gammaproteobacteria bacterium]